MGQWDDTMDIEDFLEDKKAPASVMKAWRDHMDLHNEYEKAYDELKKIRFALATLKEGIAEAEKSINSSDTE